MKTAQETKSDFLATLWELLNTHPNEKLKEYLKVRLQVLGDILGDDFPEEYQEQYEKVLTI